MSRFYFYTVSVIIAFTACSCADHTTPYLKSLKKVETVYLNAVQEYSYDGFDNFAPDEILQLDNGWIVLSSEKGDYNLHFLNLESGENFFAIPNGRGPGEMINGRNLHIFESKILYYDMMTSTAVRIDAGESIQQHRAVMDTLAVFGKDGKMKPIDLISCNSGFISGNLWDKDIWYSFFDNAGNVCSSIDAFDCDYIIDGDDGKISLMSSSIYCASTNGDKVCVANVLYPTVSFAATDDGNLEEYGRYQFENPVNLENKTNKYGCNFYSAAADENNIYLLYSGKQMKRKSLGEMMESVQCPHIIAYDWAAAVPVKHYILDKGVFYISLRGNTLLGLSTYPEYKIYRFQL